MTVEPGGSGAPMSERMQSLLSRAVEDQLSEQRQIAGVLTDLRSQLQRITNDVASLREQTPGGGSDAALSTVSADVREAVRLLGERIDGVARLVQQRGADLAELRSLIEPLQAAVRGQADALGGVGSGLSALPAFGERIGGLQDNLNALHERLAGLDNVSTGLGSLQQRVDVVDQGLRDLRSAFAAIGAKMAELPGRADLDAAAQRTSGPLEERLGGLEQAIAALSAQVSAAADRPDDADDADDGEQVAELRAELARFAATARDETHELTQRLGALDHRLTEVLDAVTPEEPEHADEPTDEPTDEEEYVEDPVLTELADLREALLGEDGIAARVEAAGAEDLDARVSSAVEQAVAASEQRLAAHIDEAVLALAEALLRRRGARAAAAPAPATPPSVAASAAASAGAAEQPADVAVSPDEPVDDAPAEDSVEEPAPAWQTPTPAGAEPAEAGGSDAERRRRPWWRPGD